MKFLDEFTLESFRQPVLFSIIGSYFLNNYPLIVAYIFNVSSNPYGESESFLIELEFSFWKFFLLLALQVFGKPGVALLLSLIKETFARWEKELLQGKFFLTYQSQNALLKKENKSIKESAYNGAKDLESTIVAFLEILKNNFRGNKIAVVYTMKTHLEYNRFWYVNAVSGELITDLGDVHRQYHSLGYAISRIKNYHFLIIQGELPYSFKKIHKSNPLEFGYFYKDTFLFNDIRLQCVKVIDGIPEISIHGHNISGYYKDKLIFDADEFSSKLGGSRISL